MGSSSKMTMKKREKKNIGKSNLHLRIDKKYFNLLGNCFSIKFKSRVLKPKPK